MPWCPGRCARGTCLRSCLFRLPDLICNCQITRDAEHPRAVADGHADSHDEYRMGSCRCLGKLLKRYSEIVVTVISAWLILWEWGGDQAATSMRNG